MSAHLCPRHPGTRLVSWSRTTSTVPTHRLVRFHQTSHSFNPCTYGRDFLLWTTLRGPPPYHDVTPPSLLPRLCRCTLVNLFLVSKYSTEFRRHSWCLTPFDGVINMSGPRRGPRVLTFSPEKRTPPPHKYPPFPSVVLAQDRPPLPGGFRNGTTGLVSVRTSCPRLDKWGWDPTFRSTEGVPKPSLIPMTLIESYTCRAQGWKKRGGTRRRSEQTRVVRPGSCWTKE